VVGQVTVPFGVGDSLLFPPQLTHGLRAGADESVVVLGLMLHAPGVGSSTHAFVQWATGGDAVGPLHAKDLASLYTSATAAAAAATTAATSSRASSAPAATVFTPNYWPKRRGIHELVPMHLSGASGSPTNRLLLVRAHQGRNSTSRQHSCLPFALELFMRSYIICVVGLPPAYDGS
jgi:hypothetical protein